MTRTVIALCRVVLLAAVTMAVPTSPAFAASSLNVEVLADFQDPWALAFLPDGRMLVTEKQGSLLLVSADGRQATAVSGVPAVDHGGQGGLGDVALHPEYAENKLVYLSYAESGVGPTRGAVVARGKLDTGASPPTLTNVEVIWRQYPKVLGRGHYGHRILFDAQGHLWVSSGERQKFTPSQDMQSNLGKLLRLHDDGGEPGDNPFVNYRDREASVDDEGIYGQIWSLGHRNPLSMAFDLEGRLWVVEMGPAGGDELNLVERGANYGYPVVSNGDHYDGREIPDHATGDGFVAPQITWTPAVSPAHLVVYRGDLFPEWRGNALVAGLSSQGIVRIELTGDRAEEVARYPMGARIRSVVEGPDGALWVLEDERKGSQGRLLRVTP